MDTVSWDSDWSFYKKANEEQRCTFVPTLLKFLKTETIYPQVISSRNIFWNQCNTISHMKHTDSSYVTNTSCSTMFCAVLCKVGIFELLNMLKLVLILCQADCHRKRGEDGALRSMTMPGTTLAYCACLYLGSISKFGMARQR